MVSPSCGGWNCDPGRSGLWRRRSRRGFTRRAKSCPPRLARPGRAAFLAADAVVLPEAGAESRASPPPPGAGGDPVGEGGVRQERRRRRRRWRRRRWWLPRRAPRRPSGWARPGRMEFQVADDVVLREAGAEPRASLPLPSSGLDLEWRPPVGAVAVLVLVRRRRRRVSPIARSALRGIAVRSIATSAATKGGSLGRLRWAESLAGGEGGAREDAAEPEVGEGGGKARVADAVREERRRRRRRTCGWTS